MLPSRRHQRARRPRQALPRLPLRRPSLLQIATLAPCAGPVCRALEPWRIAAAQRLGEPNARNIKASLYFGFTGLLVGRAEHRGRGDHAVLAGPIGVVVVAR